LVWDIGNGNVSVASRVVSDLQKSATVTETAKLLGTQECKRSATATVRRLEVDGQGQDARHFLPTYIHVMTGFYMDRRFHLESASALMRGPELYITGDPSTKDTASSARASLWKVRDKVALRHLNGNLNNEVRLFSLQSKAFLDWTYNGLHWGKKRPINIGGL
jgi:hypothetical protein